MSETKQDYYDRCVERHSGYICSLAKGHEGKHESSWFGKVMNRWPAEPEEVSEDVYYDGEPCPECGRPCLECDCPAEPVIEVALNHCPGCDEYGASHTTPSIEHPALPAQEALGPNAVAGYSLLTALPAQEAPRETCDRCGVPLEHHQTALCIADEFDIPQEMSESEEAAWSGGSHPSLAEPQAGAQPARLNCYGLTASEWDAVVTVSSDLHLKLVEVKPGEDAFDEESLILSEGLVRLWKRAKEECSK